MLEYWGRGCKSPHILASTPNGKEQQTSLVGLQSGSCFGSDETKPMPEPEVEPRSLGGIRYAWASLPLPPSHTAHSQPFY
jgi:hypothetical protein